jgi:hypothetical protein
MALYSHKTDKTQMILWNTARRLTSRSTGLAISRPFIFNVSCTPVISSVGLLRENSVLQ